MKFDGVSVIITTHNNFTEKQGCIETIIYSILAQKFNNYEILVIDNKSSKFDKKQLKDLNMNLNSFKIVFNRRNNIASARNLGANIAKYQTLLFMDDDMILPNNTIIEKIAEYSKNNQYGYSAIRKWSSPGWYKKYKNKINEKLLNNSGDYDIIIQEPNPKVRNKQTVRHLMRTYVGNFGFIHKNLLDSVGWWDEKYKGYGCEDDDLAFKLYIKLGKPCLLSDIEVVHVWHGISKKNYKQLEKNQVRFKRLLAKNNIKVFHVGRILYNEQPILD